MSPRIELLQRFLDDRDSLDEAELTRLVQWLQQSPEVCSQLKDQLLLDELLAQQHALDRADFPAQLRQRLRDAERDEDELLEQVEAMRCLASAECLEQSLGRRPSRGSWWVLAALLLLAVSATGFYLLSGIADRPQVTRVDGPVTLIRNRRSTTLLAGERLQFGDRLLTSSQGFVALRFDDGTEVQLARDSLAEFASRMLQGKTIRVDRGAVSATVARQPSSRPMRFLTPRANAQVLGTELLLEVDGDRTRLNVAEGRVQLQGLEDSTPVVVGARQSGVTEGRQATVSDLLWPSNRQGMQVGYQPMDQPPSPWQRRGAVEFAERAVQLRGGAAILPSANSEALAQACQASHALSLELVFRVNSLRQQGPARIVSLSSNEFSRNFTLGQERGHLTLQLRTSESGDNGSPPLRICHLRDRRLHHLLITYRPGLLICYLDGQRVSQSDQIRGDFSNWAPQYLLLGDEWTAATPQAWRGDVAALALYSRALDDQEALRNAAALRGIVAQLANFR